MCYILEELGSVPMRGNKFFPYYDGIDPSCSIYYLCKSTHSIKHSVELQTYEVLLYPGHSYSGRMIRCD